LPPGDVCSSFGRRNGFGGFAGRLGFANRPVKKIGENGAVHGLVCAILCIGQFFRIDVEEWFVFLVYFIMAGKSKSVSPFFG
jgi:hypothetical protein